MSAPSALLYASLSRDAFWSLLGRVEPQVDAATLDAIRRWTSSWLTETKQRAQQASPCPDAIDFKSPVLMLLNTRP